MEHMHPSTFLLSKVAGGILSGLALDKYGRKVVIIVNSAIFITGYLAGVLYGHYRDEMRDNYYELIDSMLILGYGCCDTVFDIAVPIYLVEVSPTDIRGFVGSCYKLFANTGALIVPTLYLYFHLIYLEIAWSITPAMFTLIIMFFIPETPRWLMSRGYKEKAIQALKALRGLESANIKNDIEEISVVCEQTTSKVTWKGFALPTVCKPMCIVFGLMFIQQIAAREVYMYPEMDYVNAFPYRPTYVSLSWYIAIAGLGGVLPNLLSAFAVDRFGRRVLLIVSAAIMATSMTVMGIFSCMFDQNHNGTDSVWLPMLSLLCYKFGYNFGFGIIPTYMASELLPQKTRGITCGVSIASYPLLSAIFHWCLPEFTFYLFNEQIVYWMLAGISCLAIIFVLGLVPETKKMTLEAIENYFKKQQNHQSKHACQEQKDLLDLAPVI